MSYLYQTVGQMLIEGVGTGAGAGVGPGRETERRGNGVTVADEVVQVAVRQIAEMGRTAFEQSASHDLPKCCRGLETT
jgi:hypothetical protein